MKKAVIYIRVSTADQSFARQEAELQRWVARPDIDHVEVIKEKASGKVSFAERAAGFVLNDPEVSLLVVHDIDRLGRDTIDILSTIQELTKKGTSVAVHKLGLETLLDNGKENPAAKIVFSLLATIAEMEREKIRERQREGIEAAKKRGVYKGRKKGTEEDPGQVIAKYPQVVRELRRKTSIRRTAKLCDVSPTTVQRVKAAMA